MLFFPGVCACVGGHAHRAAGAGPAHRDRGGDRLRERLDHARAAHGVRGTLRQEPVRPQHLKGIADGEIMLVPNQKN